MLKFVLSITLLLAGSTAFAADHSAPQKETQETKARPDSKRLICEDQSEIGSRLAKKRVCMTAEQWNQHEQETHESLRRGNPGTSPGG
jgi:hypothetical protein